MFLVKVGNSVFNMARITQVELVREDHVLLFGDDAMEPFAELDGADAREFWEYVCRFSADLDMREDKA